MPKDYAPKVRLGVSKQSRLQALKGAATRGGPALPAFLAGAACGTLATVLAGYVPALWTSDSGPLAAGTSAAAAAAAEPALTYEFIDRLPNDEVVTNVVPYEPPAPGAEDPRTPPRTYLLQAASFRNRDDADAMRADLLLDGMAVSISAVPRPAGGAWYRVLVGPFAGRQEMQRSLSRLRQRDIPAMPILHMPTP